jgi:tRNA A37 threonylcarbamoyladenosine biosynthesis protein TsaE
MKKTKVILLRGKRGSGKTMTMHFLYNELLIRKYINPTLDNYLPVYDFCVILKYGNKKVGIISHGDVYDDVKADLEWFFKPKVDLIVGCTRSRNVDISTFRLYVELEDEQKIQIMPECQTKYTTDKAQQTKNSHEVAILMADEVDKIIKP